MPKIVATSDLHGRLPEIPECDILLLGGDLCPDHPIGKKARYSLPDNGAEWQSNWLRDEFKPWLDAVPAKRKVAIWGNHDFVGQTGLWLDIEFGWDLLEDDTVEIDGIRIHGTPWVPGLPRWAFYQDDRALKMRAESIPDCDILLSHGPPYGHLDFVAPQFGSQHVGDTHLNWRLHQGGIGVMVCGHIHEQYGSVAHHSGTVICNVSHVNEFYEPVNAPRVIADYAWQS